MSPDDKSISEIGRSMDRVEAVVTKLANDMQKALGPIAVHAARINQIDKHLESTDKRLGDTDEKIGQVKVHAAYLSGAIAAGGFFVNWLMGRH